MFFSLIHKNERMEARDGYRKKIGKTINVKAKIGPRMHCGLDPPQGSLGKTFVLQSSLVFLTIESIVLGSNSARRR